MRITVRRTCLIIVLLVAVKGCILFADGKAGHITDARTGKPLEGVVVIRTWVNYAVPFSHSASFLAFDETLSDKDGKYYFPFKVSPFLSMSFINESEEMPLLFYKPSYGFTSNSVFMAVSTTTPDVALTRVPESYFSRLEEVESAKKLNWYVNYDKTKLLKKVIAAEESFIRGMPKSTTGIFYMGSLNNPINSIFTDTNDNLVIIEDRVEPCLLAKDGTPLDTQHNASISTHREITKRIAENYPHGTDNVSIINLGQHYILLHAASLDVVNAEGKLVCNYTVPNKGLSFEDKNSGNILLTVPQEQIKFADISNDKKGDFYIGYPVGEGYSGVLKTDKHCKPIFNQRVDLYRDTNREEINKDLHDLKSKGFAVTRMGHIIIASSNSIYIFSQDLKLIHIEYLNDREFGTVDITRILSDREGENLFILDKQYSRILKYNLRLLAFAS